MAINKVVYNGGTLIDLTGDTVTADKLMQGYTAHDKSGEIIIGTATGGGGGSVTQDQDGFIVLPPDGGGSPSVSGLEYEEGIFTPSEDISEPTINFTNTHTTRPFAVIIADATNDTEMVADSVITWELFSFHDAIGESAHYGGTSVLYGRVQYAAKGTSSGSLSASGYNITNLTGTGTTSMERWVSSSGFMPYAGSSSRFFRAGRTYKWIAVWAPTT